MLGSDDTGPDSSLVGRRKEIPLLSPSGGTIGHDQRHERHAHSPSQYTGGGTAVYLAWSSHRPGDRLDADGCGGVRS